MTNVLEMLMVKSLFLAGHKTVIVDSTNMKTKYRDRWISSEHDTVQWELCYEFFHTSKDSCIERAKKDGRDDLIPIIETTSSDSYNK